MLKGVFLLLAPSGSGRRSEKVRLEVSEAANVRESLQGTLRQRPVSLPALLGHSLSQLPWSRTISRMHKLRARLGGSANLREPFPLRPRYMHHRTKLRARYMALLGLNTHQPICCYALDAAILFSEILVVPDALGQEVG